MVAHSDAPGSNSWRFWLLLPLVAVLAFFLTVWIAAPLRDGAEPASVLRAIVHYVYERVPDFLAGQPLDATPSMQDVLVASTNLRPPLVLGKDNVRWQPWPENALRPVFITRSSRPDALDALTGSIVRNPMNVGEPIREANLMRRRDEFTAAPPMVPAGPSNTAPKPEGQQQSDLTLQAWRSADVTTLMQKLGTKSRGFLERYIAAPTEKALAREKGGTYLVESHGWRTVEDARQAALETCQRMRSVCEFVMENDHWL
jgi:hypothetical protein